MKKRAFLLIGIALVVGTAGYWWLHRRPGLVDLQKRYVFAETEEERAEIIDAVVDHYRHLAVPDSITRKVTSDVRALVDTAALDPARFLGRDEAEDNPYALEHWLHKELFRAAMLARARDDRTSFDLLITEARNLAARVDRAKNKAYWVPFVGRASAFMKEQALAWLGARHAAIRCKNVINVDYRAAGHYASLALQNLRKVDDARLRLEVLMRCQYMLFFFHGLSGISIGLGEYIKNQATDIGDVLRAVASTYNRAEASKVSGQIGTAQELFEEIIEQSTLHKEIPWIDWYEVRARIFLAETYWQLGVFDQALSICDALEPLHLALDEKMLLHKIRGLTYYSLGNYEVAESHYRRALVLADSAGILSNQIIYLKDIGHIHFELMEYDMALETYAQVQTLLKKHGLVQSEQMVNTLINMAQVRVAKNQKEASKKLVSQASALMTNVGVLPVRKADLLATLGEFHLESGEVFLAFEKYKDAVNISERHGLMRMALKYKIELGECLIELQRFTEARARLEEAMTLALKSDASEQVIDALALLAEVEARESNLEKAVELSNRLLREIEHMSLRFRYVDRLTSYRQKIYGYLKKAVLYEIRLNRIDSAFVKLDYAKGRSLKGLEGNTNGKVQGGKLHPDGQVHYLHLDKVKKALDLRTLLVDYLVTQDTLYAFILARDKLQLLKKPIQAGELTQRAQDYIDAIKKTVDVFSNYDAKNIKNHYENTTALGRELFDHLLGWPALKVRLSDVDIVYIVPDEFLFELPFSTLAVNGADAPTHLVEKAAVAILPSSSLLPLPSEQETHSLLSNRRILLCSDGTIPGANDFVASVDSLFPWTTVLHVREGVSKQDILSEFTKGYDVYVIIGHGVANSQFPERSYLEFKAQLPTAADETIRISAAELGNGDWSSAELVMLVGCETGGGKLYRGTGISGLHHSILTTRGRNVLASLWKIDAGHALPQAVDFLKRWLVEPRTAVVLRKMQSKNIAELRQDSYYRFPHPYFWANFGLISRN